MTAAVIAFSIASQASGAAGVAAPSMASRAQGALNARVSAPEQTAEGNGLAIRSGLGTSVALSRFAGGSFRGRQSVTRTLGVASESGGEAHCRSARRGLAFYRGRYAEHRAKMGAPADGARSHRENRCPRYLAQVWKRKSYAARLAFERWHSYHYDWRSWLPERWQQIGACETGYGRRPGQWTWNSGTYQGAFGFHYGTWDVYRHRADPKAGACPDDAYEATPRQQYEVAQAVYRAVGYGAWGCA